MNMMDECWEWTGGKDLKGYGVKRFGSRPGRLRLLHRVAYEWANGPIPPGLCVCHRCDNPPCVNPEHLFLGTRADNNQDMRAKGRISRGQGRYNAKLTEEAVIEIRRLKRAGESSVVLGERYGISRQHIDQVCNGRLWGWVPLSI